METQTFSYVGAELELFATAHNWKDYLSRQIWPYLGGTVLEVGAGLGAVTRTLAGATHRRWVCLEPDVHQAAQLSEQRRSGKLPPFCEVVTGMIGDVIDRDFDSILYIDVLEHIERDAAELAAAEARLAPSGRLIVLSPAYQWLYSEFDRGIGHYRRYTTASLAAVVPPSLRRLRLRYLDSVGVITSVANKLILGQSMPTARQIALWDRLLVPVSRSVDPVVRYAFGRSVLGVWQLT